MQTSGTAGLVDDARGAFASSRVYDNEDLADFWSLPETVYHRETDLIVLFQEPETLATCGPT
jgi:hypothetical protein